MLFPKIGPVELILILVIVTMLFGVGKLPEVFGAVGRGIREFRRGASEPDADKHETAAPSSETPASSTTAESLPSDQTKPSAQA
ncbi:MAG TPA: twin-arginine translocase TatA/TatE family subunit [Caldilineaceae bacterium]|nr:twin-arginine translocase TatA/TatE family subunit [Caldilineaceae bacterium]